MNAVRLRMNAITASTSPARAITKGPYAPSAKAKEFGELSTTHSTDAVNNVTARVKDAITRMIVRMVSVTDRRRAVAPAGATWLSGNGLDRLGRELLALCLKRGDRCGLESRGFDALEGTV